MTLPRLPRPPASAVATWRAIRTASSEPWEAWLGIFALLWGLWLLNPWSTVFGSSPGFRAMAALLSEGQWGFLIAGVGTMQLVGLWRHNRGARVVAAWSAWLLWTFLAFSFGLSNPASTGLLAYGMIAAAAAYAGLLLGSPRWT